MDPADLTEARVAEMVSGVAAYLCRERELYFRASEPLSPGWRTTVQAYFSASLLDSIRTIILKGARIPPPPFYSEAMALSSGNFPDFVHLASFTYLDTIVFHDEIALRTLLHGLVHAAEMAFLGPDRYTDFYRSRFREVPFLDCYTTRSTGLLVGHAFRHVPIDELFRGRGSEVLGRTGPVLARPKSRQPQGWNREFGRPRVPVGRHPGRGE